jgi:nucleotide-binding universal stress UspA family protein
MSEIDPINYEVALQDFKRARKQAAVQHLLAQLTGKSDELLAYDYVSQQLRSTGTIDRGLQEIPLDAIVGSVGRYDDFTRDFLPKKDSIQERWAHVKAAILSMTGMAPISVYQVGEVFFVRDGNHRVSVARQLGTPTISAHVTEVKTKVPLSIDDDLDEVQCKARYAEFLEKTKLDESRPDAYLLLTFRDSYHSLFSQIDAYHHKSAEDSGCVLSYQEAVVQWYDNVYLPVVNIIREQGILQYFPERTEADLYLLFVEHRDELESALGWHIDTDLAVVSILEQKANEPHSVLGWLGLQLYKNILPEQLDAGPETGHWRKIHLAHRKRDTLFSHILVGLRKQPDEWQSIKHAITIAKRENGTLYGLHVTSDEETNQSIAIEQIGLNFRQLCQSEGVLGEFTVERGNIARTILKRAAWADLVVVSLTQPPQSQTLKRFGDGFNLLVQRCSRPLLIVPDGTQSPMDQAMLAYDGSPKANEALFVAAYMAKQWLTQLIVITVETKNTPGSALQRAKAYLEKQGVKDVNYLLAPRPIGDALLESAETHASNLMIMGGFGFRPVKNLVLGSTVDQVLREFKKPILICR